VTAPTLSVPETTYIAYLWEYPELTAAVFGMQNQSEEAAALYAQSGIQEQMEESLTKEPGLLCMRGFLRELVGSRSNTGARIASSPTTRSGCITWPGGSGSPTTTARASPSITRLTVQNGGSCVREGDAPWVAEPSHYIEH
jgi:hypothetical protein